MKNNDTDTIFYVCLFSVFFSDKQVITIETPYQVKEEEENAMHNTVVIFSSNDNFTLIQVFFYLILKSVADVFNFESSSIHFF